MWPPVTGTRRYPTTPPGMRRERNEDGAPSTGLPKEVDGDVAHPSPVEDGTPWSVEGFAGEMRHYTRACRA